MKFKFKNPFKKQLEKKYIDPGMDSEINKDERKKIENEIRKQWEEKIGRELTDKEWEIIQEDGYGDRYL